MYIDDLDLFYGKVSLGDIYSKLLKCHGREKLPGNGQMDRIFMILIKVTLWANGQNIYDSHKSNPTGSTVLALRLYTCSQTGLLITFS